MEILQPISEMQIRIASAAHEFTFHAVALAKVGKHRNLSANIAFPNRSKAGF
jgi:hypothetical protein